MSEMEKLQNMLDDLLIDWEFVCRRISPETTPYSIYDDIVIPGLHLIVEDYPDGLGLRFDGYGGQFRYSAEYVARMVDRKFKTEICKGCQFEKSCAAAIIGW